MINKVGYWISEILGLFFFVTAVSQVIALAYFFYLFRAIEAPERAIGFTIGTIILMFIASKLKKKIEITQTEEEKKRYNIIRKVIILILVAYLFFSGIPLISLL